MAAYYCFFPGDYLRDTIHLGQLEDLAYRRLLDLYYSKARPLPNDRAYIMRAIRAADPDLQNAADNVLAEFFVLGRDGWRNEKAERELDRLRSFAERGKRAAEARWNKNNAMTDAQAMHKHRFSITPTPTPTSTSTSTSTPTIKTKEANASLSSAAEAAAARRLLEFLNERAQRSYKPIDAHIKLIRARLKEHGEPTLRAMVAIKCREWRTDPKMSEYLRPGTLFNATKCADYVGRVGTFEENA